MQIYFTQWCVTEMLHKHVRVFKWSVNQAIRTET